MRKTLDGTRSSAAGFAGTVEKNLKLCLTVIVLIIIALIIVAASLIVRLSRGQSHFEMNVPTPPIVADSLPRDTPGGGMTIVPGDAGARIALERSLRQELESSILNLLRPVYGADNVRVAVWVTLGFDDIETETAPDPAENVPGGMVSGTRVKLAKGYVAELSIAIGIDSGAIDGDYTAQVRSLVAAAVGASEDNITIETLPFSVNMSLRESGETQGLSDINRHIGLPGLTAKLCLTLAVLIIVLLFLIILFLTRRRSFATTGQPDEDSITAEHAVSSESSEPPFSPEHFGFLRRTDSADILSVLQGEHQQTAALTLSYVEPKCAAEVLAALPERERAGIIERISSMGKPILEYVREAERVMRRAVTALGLRDKPDADAELASGPAPQRSPIAFEDIASLNADTIRAATAEVSSRDLALVLRLASPDIARKISGAVPRRLAREIREQAEAMGPVSVREVEQARRRMTGVLNRLDSGSERGV